MDTIVDKRATSVAIRRARTNSRAVEASSPLVELAMRSYINDCSIRTEKPALVPCRDGGAKRESLANRNTLLLTAGHASDGSITDLCIFNMAQTKNCLYDIGYNCHIGAARTILEASMWCAHLGCKPQRLIDREGGEMNVILRTVRDVTAEVLRNILWRERVVVYFTLNKMIFYALIGERFQQCAAPRARASQDNWGNELNHSNPQAVRMKEYRRSISPGRRTPSKPVRMSR